MYDLIQVPIINDRRDPVRKTLDELTEQLHNQQAAIGGTDYIDLLYKQGVDFEDVAFMEYFQYMVDYRELVDSWAAEDLQARKKETDWARVKRNSAGAAVMGLYLGGPLGAAAAAGMFALATYVEERTTRIKTDLRPAAAAAVVGAGIDLLLGTPLIVSAACAGVATATGEIYAMNYLEQEQTRLLLYGSTLEEQQERAVDRLKGHYVFRIHQAWNKVKICIIRELEPEF